MAVGVFGGIGSFSWLVILCSIEEEGFAGTRSLSYAEDENSRRRLACASVHGYLYASGSTFKEATLLQSPTVDDGILANVKEKAR